MIFKGLKMQVSCYNWEQVKILGDFWDEISSTVDINKLVGIGYGWENDYFNYAIGLIDDFEKLEIVKNLKIANTEYFEIVLPNKGWKTEKGKTSEIRQIYENKFDCYNTNYKYEIEKFNSEGNCEISVYYEN